VFVPIFARGALGGFATILPFDAPMLSLHLPRRCRVETQTQTRTSTLGKVGGAFTSCSDRDDSNFNGIRYQCPTRCLFILTQLRPEDVRPRTTLSTRPAPRAQRDDQRPVELLAHFHNDIHIRFGHPQAALVLQIPLSTPAGGCCPTTSTWAPATTVRSARGFAKEHVMRCRAASTMHSCFRSSRSPCSWNMSALVGQMVRTSLRSFSCAGQSSQCDMFLSIPRCRYVANHLHFLREGVDVSGKKCRRSILVEPLHLRRRSVRQSFSCWHCPSQHGRWNDEGETQWFTYTCEPGAAAAVRDGGAEPALLHDQPCFSSRACSASCEW